MLYRLSDEKWLREPFHWELRNATCFVWKGFSFLMLLRWSLLSETTKHYNCSRLRLTIERMREVYCNISSFPKKSVIKHQQICSVSLQFFFFIVYFPRSNHDFAQYGLQIVISAALLERKMLLTIGCVKADGWLIINLIKEAELKRVFRGEDQK